MATWGSGREGGERSVHSKCTAASRSHLAVATVKIVKLDETSRQTVNWEDRSRSEDTAPSRQTLHLPRVSKAVTHSRAPSPIAVPNAKARYPTVTHKHSRARTQMVDRNIVFLNKLPNVTSPSGSVTTKWCFLPFW